MEEQINNISDPVASPKGFCRTAGEYLSTHRGARATLISAAIVLLLIFLIAVPVYIAPALQHSWGKSRAECRVDSALLSDKVIRKQVAVINTEIIRLERKLASFIPTQTYIVINTTDNRFSLYRNRQLIREGFVSSGSYTLLKTEDGEKEWIFRTPRGLLWKKACPSPVLPTHRGLSTGYWAITLSAWVTDILFTAHSTRDCSACR
jgi:hypothetical protein